MGNIFQVQSQPPPDEGPDEPLDEFNPFSPFQPRRFIFPTREYIDEMIADHDPTDDDDDDDDDDEDDEDDDDDDDDGSNDDDSDDQELPIFRRPGGRTRTTTVPCKFYASGTCAFGDSCRFVHDGPSYLSPAQKTRRTCRYFAAGNCWRGDRCRFSHDQPTQREKLNEDRLALDPSSVDEWKREMGGAWAEFGDGAAVTKISLPSDFSAIRITDLPMSTSVGNIMGILSEVGLRVQASDVQISKKAHYNCSAVVKAEDPAFARSACKKLRNQVTFEELTVTPIPVPMTKGTHFEPTDHKQVHCSWFRPTTTADLEFDTFDAASRVQRRFDTGLYKVEGLKYEATPPAERSNDQGEQVWFITLEGLPELVIEEEIMEDIPDNDIPKRINIAEPNYEEDEDMNGTIIRSLLDKFGWLEDWTVLSRPESKRVNARATFAEEAQARKAAARLHMTELPFCRSQKLYVRLVTTVRFKVSTRVFRAVASRINLRKGAWRKNYVHFFESPSSDFQRILKLEGEDAAAVARVKRELDSIIEGKVMKLHGKDLWLADLGIQSGTLSRLNRIERELGVVIIRDMSSSQLRVFGPRERYYSAVKEMHHLIKDITFATHFINLVDPADLEWARSGGVKVIQAKLGERKAFFDQRSRRIVVRGSDQEVNEAMLIISRRQERPMECASAQNDCTICFCEAEQPLVTSCGHTYCTLCYVSLCQSAADNPKDFNIICLGDGGCCEEPLDIMEIRDNLISEAFEDILRASFASYVRRHPENLRYCPSPGCNQVYRISSIQQGLPATFTCPECSMATCTGCHSSHPNGTCADHDDSAYREAQELLELKELLGIQECPKCNTNIEKISGCSHMTCRACGVDICWLCLTTFPRAEQCYDHITRVHGDNAM